LSRSRGLPSSPAPSHRCPWASIRASSQLDERPRSLPDIQPLTLWMSRGFSTCRTYLDSYLEVAGAAVPCPRADRWTRGIEASRQTVSREPVAAAHRCGPLRSWGSSPALCPERGMPPPITQPASYAVVKDHTLRQCALPWWLHRQRIRDRSGTCLLAEGDPGRRGHDAGCAVYTRLGTQPVESDGWG
jgi:hypothetical protein